MVSRRPIFSRREPPPLRTWGDHARASGTPLYTLPGYGESVFRKLTPQGWPVFNLARDPVTFGPLTVQGERGEAFTAWAREQGLCE